MTLLTSHSSPLGSWGTLPAACIGALAGQRLFPLGPASDGIYWLPSLVGTLTLILVWQSLFPRRD